MLTAHQLQAVMDEESLDCLSEGPTGPGNATGSKPVRLEATPDDKSVRVQDLLHGINLVLKHHEAPFEIIRSFREQATDYLSVESELDFVARAKYLLVLPITLYLKNEKPKSPTETPLKFTGRFWRWARQRVNCFSRKNTHLWFSFYQAKRAADPVSSDVVLANLQKHRAQMGQPDPLLENDSSRGVSDDLYEAIKPLISKLAKKMHPDLVKIFNSPDLQSTLNTGQRQLGFRVGRDAARQHAKIFHKISESAAFERSRLNGGASGWLFDIMRSGSSLRSTPTLIAVSSSRFPELNGRRVTTGIAQDHEIHEDELEHLVSEIRSALDGAQFGVPVYTARIAFVLEPLKVRTISKGPVVPYYVGKIFQEIIHREMRKMPCFRLLGRPFSPTDLIDLRVATAKLYQNQLHKEDRTSSLIVPDMAWHSVDYSAATDGLSASASARVMTGLLERVRDLNKPLYNLLLGTLAPHYIRYPMYEKTLDTEGPTGIPDTRFEEILPPIQQVNGQLMGSITSFPILCLVNIALYLLVKLRHSPKARLEDLLNAVLVNGDDMLYIGTAEEWHTHMRLGAQVGLAFSPGKAYRHRVYANINSESVHYDLFNESSVPFSIPYFNVGLLIGNGRYMKRVGEVTIAPHIAVELAQYEADHPETKFDPSDSPYVTPMISVINAVVDGALDKKKADVFKMLMSIHKDEYKIESLGRNLFLPITLGGFGVKPIPGITTRVTPYQVRLADRLVRAIPYATPLVLPMPRGRILLSPPAGKIDPLRLAIPNYDRTYLPKVGSLNVWLHRDLLTEWVSFLPSTSKVAPMYPFDLLRSLKNLIRSPEYVPFSHYVIPEAIKAPEDMMWPEYEPEDETWF